MWGFEGSRRDYEEYIPDIDRGFTLSDLKKILEINPDHFVGNYLKEENLLEFPNVTSYDGDLPPCKVYKVKREDRVLYSTLEGKAAEFYYHKNLLFVCNYDANWIFNEIKVLRLLGAEKALELALKPETKAWFQRIIDEAKADEAKAKAVEKTEQEWNDDLYDEM